MKPSVETFKNKELIAWIPPTTSEIGKIIAAIALTPNQVMDEMIYLKLLGDRVAWMIQESESPENALEYLNEICISDSLLMNPVNLQNLTVNLLMSNLAVQEQMSLQGIEMKFPIQVSKSNQQAEQILLETSLENWTDALTFHHNHHGLE